MSWAEVTRGWNELYQNSPKAQKFFEEAAPTIAKLGVESRIAAHDQSNLKTDFPPQLPHSIV